VRTKSLQGVHGVEQGSGDKSARPKHRRGINEKMLGDTANRVTDQLRRHDQKPLVYIKEFSPIFGSADMPQLTTKVWILVEEDLLDGNYISLNAT
jgi:hypothetical protein